MPEIDAVLDHLWMWPMVDSDSFDDWYDFDNSMFQFALGDPAPADLVANLPRSQFTEGEIRELMMSTIEIVNGNLFTVVDKRHTLDCLQTIELIANRHESMIPEHTIFDGQPGVAPSSHGWGDRLTRAEIDTWRSLAW